MKIIKSLSIILLLIPVVAYSQNDKEKVYKAFDLEVNLEYRYFFNDGLYEKQENNFLSIAVKPECFIEWQDGKYSLKFTGFGRIDQHDSRRTHFDVRELYWQWVEGSSELSVGLKKIFWGVTESIHLVDIINQTDAVESFDGEQKLGQPMIHYSKFTSVGIFDAFVLPYFRTRQFPGDEGRLRTPFILDGSEFAYESNSEEFRPSIAARWSHTIGRFDLGLSHFYGTGRAPIIADFTTFQPIYAIITQTGLDVQATTGPLLWKVEVINRNSEFQDMRALAAGFEYTFGNIGRTGIDIGVVGEYLYDNRNKMALSSMDNDVFAGLRLALNDVKSTQLLMGGVFDLERSTKIYSIEGSRRIGNSWKAEIEARIFEQISNEEFLYFIRRDSFIKFSIAKYF